jgi:hypothetical protein
MDHRELTSTAAVMDALGGTRTVADLTGRTYAAAFNWRSFKTFPADTYVALTAALRGAGCVAPDALWGMVPAQDNAPENASAAS